MAMDTLKITLVQLDIIWENAQSNINHITLLIKDIVNTDIIVLPEMFATGFSMNPDALAHDSYKVGVDFMRAQAQLKECVVCGSLMCFDNGNYYNRFVWMQPSGEMVTYDKRHLFTMGDEPKHYSAGKETLIIDYKGWRIRPLICYDLRFPVWSRNKSNNPFDILLYVANWPSKRVQQWNKLLQARAIENSCFVIGVNRVGVDGNGFAYSGGSASVDFLGEVEMLTDNVECLQTIALDKAALYSFRSQFPVLLDADDFVVK